jgi:hypothetical protein
MSSMSFVIQQEASMYTQIKMLGAGWSGITDGGQSVLLPARE